MKLWPAVRPAVPPQNRSHDLRHTAASLLSSPGVNVMVVSERLGRESVEITLGVYARVLPTMQQVSTHKLDLVFALPLADDKKAANNWLQF